MKRKHSAVEKSIKVLFSNWYKIQVELPNGKGTAQRDLIFHNGAVCVLAINQANKIVLVKQYRKAIEKVSVEIPAGKLEIGENADPEAAALRELEEEAAYTGKLNSFV